MKVAVSIPDPTFVKVEQLAKKWKMSRSKVYTRALDRLVAEHGDDEITRLANEAAQELTAEERAFLAAGANTAIQNTEW